VGSLHQNSIALRAFDFEHAGLFMQFPFLLILRRDYPYTTVPNQVHRLFRAQQLHDRKHYDARLEASPQERAKMPYIDYLRPIIADGDTG
jgi:hypothetical protein